MADKMSAFVVDVAEDPDRLDQFAANPERELDRAGLTDAQKTAVLTRDSSKVRAALGGSTLAANDEVLEVPGPPPPPPPPPKRKPPRKRKPPTKKRPKRPRRPSRKRPARKRGPSRPSRKKR